MFWEKESWNTYSKTEATKIEKVIKELVERGYKEYQIDAAMYAMNDWGFSWGSAESYGEIVKMWIVPAIENNYSDCDGGKKLCEHYSKRIKELEKKYKIEEETKTTKKSKTSDKTKISKLLWDTYCESVDNTLNAIKKEYEAKIKRMDEIYTERLNSLVIDKSPIRKVIEKDGTAKDKLTHSKFDMVLRVINSQSRIQKNVMLVGPAGSGKTQLAADIAQTVNLNFYPMSVGPQTTKSDLLGFVNPYGKYVTTPIREAFEKGGILLLDEFDAAHPGVVTILNSLLANGHCSFPDKIVHKHKDFICIVACNTFGDGTSYQYIGRNKLDAATLDRFVAINVGYDDGLSKILTKNDEWYKIVMDIRKNATENKIDIVISTRTLLNGADLIDNGFTIKEALDTCLFKGCDNNVKEILLKGIKL